VHYYDPHFPYDPPEPYRQRYAKDGYAGEVAYTDELIGRLLKSLLRQGLQGNTLIVILSDHGESLGEHGEETHGVFLYDSTMHIPFIMAGPGLPEGQVVAQQVRSIDLMPSILDYLGISAGEQVQGTTLLPAMTDGKRVRTDYAYMETLYPKTHMGWSELRAMRTDDWKLVVAPRPELYRLSSDRDESRNIIDDHSREADRLRQRVQEIAGAESQGDIEYEAMDEETLKQLQALGYVSAGKARNLQFDFSGPDPKDRVQVLQTLDRATDLMNHDRFAAAAPLLEKIVSQDPSNPLLYQQLGVCLQETGEFSKALQVYKRAVENKADTDRTHAEIGEIHIRFGDLGRAIESMEHAADLNPSNLDNFSNLANAYLQSRRLNDAEGAVGAIFAQDPDHAGGHNLMGLIMIHSGRSALARSHFQQAIQSNPDSAEPYMNLGLLAQQSNQPELALGYYKSFVERAGDQPQFREIVPKVKAAIADLDSLMAQRSR
ncbi:MAG: tetratricopeptide repeat protein, partial [Acidobacteriota bacterium]